MIREAVAGDEPALEAYLAKNFATTMFMRGNLRDFGLGNTVDMYAMRYFIALKNGVITAVCAVANFGTIMAQAEGSFEKLAEFARAQLSESFVCMGLLGTPEQVAQLKKTFVTQGVTPIYDKAEPLFSMDLEYLVIPDFIDHELRKAEQKDMPLLAKWAYDYTIEVGLRPAGDASRAEAIEEAKSRVNTERFKLLIVNKQPVAQVLFNATMPDCVQIGAVFTPPEFRCKGYGRLVVAQHLAQARENGAQKAVLFSASENASRAYRAIGFQQIGTYVITLFNIEKD